MDYIKNKKNTVYLLLIMVGLLSLVIGTSYAILKGTESDSNEQVIKTGSVKLKLTEYYDNISEKITVKSDEDGLLNTNSYEFNIKNIGNSPARYDLKLINDVPGSYTGKVLDTKYIKIGLEINGEEYGPMSLEKVKNIIDSDVIYKNEVLNYKLRIWLDKSKEDEIANLEDYKAFLKLKIEATQRPESMDSESTKTFNYTGKTEEYTVPRDGYYYIEMGGATGNNNYNDYTKAHPGYAAKTSGYIYLDANEKLYFNVGGMKKTFNCCSKQGDKSGSGGATDVRVYGNNIKPSKKYRYVRNYINGSSKNSASHWVEIKVYDESGNVISNGKSVSYNGTGPHYGGTATSPNAITDGNTTSDNYFGLEGSNDSYVEIDLGSEYIISKIEVWHYYSDGRTYNDQKTELLTSDKKINSIIYTSSENGTYAETSSGKAMSNIYLTKDLTSRIMVAGGAGGTYQDSSAPKGGNASGLYSEYVYHTSYTVESTTQTSGGTANLNGTAGSFGYGGTNSTTYYNSGGGGYYGGGAGPAGGGGSSYISGYAGVNSVKDFGTLTHTGDTLHYSGKYFIGGQISTYYNTGDGYAKISYVDTKPKRRNTKLNDVRYIKSCVGYNTANNYNHFTELQAIKDGVNVAKGKSITGTGSNPFSRVVDGDISPSNYVDVSDPSNNSCVVVDLGSSYDLDEVALWNYFGDPRSYYNNKTYVSKDNSNWTEILNEASIETSNGHRINAYVDNYNGYVSDGLVLWYDGYANTGTDRNYTTTTWKDLSGKGNTSTLSGPTWYDNYLSFDGSNDYAYKSSGVVYNISKYNTIEVLYKIEKIDTNYQMLFNTHKDGQSINQYGALWLFSNYTMGYEYADGSSNFSDSRISVTSNDINKFMLLTSTRNNRTYKLFNKSNLINEKEFSFDAKTPEASVYVGGPENYFKGKIYSIRVYNKALTQEEVEHNYQYDKQKFNLD